MARYDLALAAWLQAHHGVVTAAQLKDLGLTDAQRARITSTGRFRREQRGIFVASAAAQTVLQAAALACASTGGVLCGISAGHVWGHRRLPPAPSPPTVLVMHRHAPRTRLATVVRVGALDPADVVTRLDGIRVTSPPRTVFDLASLVDAAAVESIIEQCLDREVFTLLTLQATANRLSGRGRPGADAFRRLMNCRAIEQQPVDSDLELRLERALIRAGADRPVRQYGLYIDHNVTIHGDLAWPDLRFIVEVDHSTWHAGRQESAYDKRRDRKVARQGWAVARVTEIDIDRRLGETVNDLLALMDQARARRSVA